MKRPENDSIPGQVILDPASMSEKVRTLGETILKEFGASERLALVGIQTRGAHLARRIASYLEKKLGRPIPLGILDITLYRDDVNAIADQPEVKETDIPFDIDNRPLILIDDVLYTGRTVRSAMNALIDYGRPECIRLAVLIDRGNRELPIGADYVALTLPTDESDVVDVNVDEVDGEDCVRLRKRPGKTDE